MEVNNKRVLEAFLGLILIILLVIMIILLTAPKNLTGSSTTITNSFNTNNYYNAYPTIKHYPYTKTYYKKDYLDYDYHACKKTLKGILGNSIEHYIVYVRNQDYKPGYFKVKYYFTDYYGNTKTETMTYYIKPKQGKEFIYKNIYKDKYKFHDWDYEVISRTSV